MTGGRMSVPDDGKGSLHSSPVSRALAYGCAGSRAGDLSPAYRRVSASSSEGEEGAGATSARRDEGTGRQGLWEYIYLCGCVCWAACALANTKIYAYIPLSYLPGL